jgi:hypothetical protein
MNGYLQAPSCFTAKERVLAIHWNSWFGSGNGNRKDLTAVTMKIGLF